MMNKCDLPTVKVLKVYEVEKNIRTVIEFNKESKSYLIEPIAPSQLSLYKKNSIVFLFPLHKVISKNNLVLEFETYEYNGNPPGKGKTYSYQSWFTPNQIVLITDTKRTWHKEKIVGNSDIHCSLTWESLLPDVEAYTDGEVWISSKAYEDFIKKDVSKLREGGK